ncbi:MAG: DUF6128 domain-containing protein [bacterium]|nr:DUF6128 domain-containing protein [bacterium]
MYEQKMCYIDLYRNGVKCGNMGHVRIEWDGERYRFGANLCHMDRQTLVTTILERTGGRPRTTIRNIAIVRGRGSAQFDWMPLDGNEDRLLFQASGEIYGICRLPRMGGGTERETEELSAGEPPVYSATPTEADQNDRAVSRLPEPQTDTPGGTEHTAEKESGVPKRAEHTAEKESDVPERAEHMEEKESGVPERAARITGEADRAPTAEPRVPEKKGGMLEAVLKTMEKQNSAAREPEPQGAARERARRDTAHETVVLHYPQGMEERRRRERHVTALSDDKWKQLCNIYPTVHPIGDEIEFIKITPADFVVLRQEYQNLVRNSFLLHGYYNYEHILLGKYPDKYYIGVPGIMHEQERLAAAMFGFVGFERAEAPKEQKENRDQFGYYMMEVGI